MIAGAVNARREAVVQLRLRGAGGVERSVNAVVDTGFSGYLTLPDGEIAAMGLTRHSTGGAVLADGTVRQFAVYEAEVWWGAAWRVILVSAVGSEVLAGMRLLDGHELRIEVAVGGAVAVTPLP
jgi:clan AA aspartic protease